MLGLLLLLIGGIYLFISIWLIKFTAKQANKRNIAGWKWGAPVGLLMYLLIFWDHIPTLLAHQYYCSTEAGFTVYKTIDEWKKENPGVAETLTYKEVSDSEKTQGGYVYHLNERFDWLVNNETLFLTVKRNNNKVIDISNNEVLAEYTDFSSGYGNPMTYKQGQGWGVLKMWLMNDSCDRTGYMVNRKGFNEFENKVQKLGEWR